MTFVNTIAIAYRQNSAFPPQILVLYHAIVVVFTKVIQSQVVLEYLDFVHHTKPAAHIFRKSRTTVVVVEVEV